MDLVSDDRALPGRPRPAVSIIALVAANAIPLLGVIFLGWRVFSILLIYWMENVVVGVFNVLRILFADPHPPQPPLPRFGRAFLVAFFCLHYGLFTDRKSVV